MNVWVHDNIFLVLCGGRVKAMGGQHFQNVFYFTPLFWECPTPRGFTICIMILADVHSVFLGCFTKHNSSVNLEQEIFSIIKKDIFFFHKLIWTVVILQEKFV